MKILLVSSSLFVGGMERQMLELSRGLIARGHTVHVSVPYAGDPQEIVFEALGVRVIPELPNRTRSWKRRERAMRVPLRWRNLRRTIKAGRYDIVHGYGVSSNIYATAASLGLPARSVWGIRDSTPLASRTQRLMEKALLPTTSLVIANSAAGRQVCLDRGLPEDKTILIENGLDVNRFRIDPSSREAVRQELGVGDHELLIGTIGRVQPAKNVEGFLRGGAIVASRHPDVRFLVMGPGEASYVGHLRSMATELGIADRTIWLGPQFDVERYDNALDVFVSATRHMEGMMNTALEAMACGTPCVVTNMGSIAEVVGPAGQVIADDSPHTIAEATEAVIANGNAWTRESIRARVIDRFSTDRLAERTEGEFARILEDG